MGLISGFVTFIKTGNPLFFKSRCQIWSELIQVKHYASAPYSIQQLQNSDLHPTLSGFWGIADHHCRIYIPLLGNAPTQQQWISHHPPPGKSR